MILKIFRALWFFSVIILFADLLYVYAQLPLEVFIQKDAEDQIYLERETFFYIALIIGVVVNVLVYITKLLHHKEDFRAWFHGLIMTINIFLIVSLSLISLFNNDERFDYTRIGFVIYGAIGLVITWALSWPVIGLYQKFYIKNSV